MTMVKLKLSLQLNLINLSLIKFKNVCQIKMNLMSSYFKKIFTP